MLVLSLSPVIASIGFVGLLVTLLAVMFVVGDRPRRERRHDPELEARLLTLKLRHPWRYRRARLAQRLTEE
jgi:hypothetical protein